MTHINITKNKMQSAIEHLKVELTNIRTGRANPAMVENIQVEVYGTQMRLKDVANVTVPEPRQLLITPFDRGTTASIGKSIEAANIGVRPIVEADRIRINIPPMDTSIRNEMAKICRERREEAKVSIRNARREGNDAVRKQKASGELPEDQANRMEKEIQELTDKFCKQSDELAEAKEKEITTV